METRTHNLLILSDLHLGCDLKPDAPYGDARRAGLDRVLVRFLDHHALRREDGKPWRLLLAGDIFDFVAVTATPAPLLTPPFAICAEERRLGLAPEEEKCVWKLRRIAARHEELFHALARFLLTGHEVHFIRGNHDAELQFPSVQAELLRLLGRRAGVDGPQLERLERSVQFHAWFYLEPGVVYVEHGNAHDRYCLQSGFFDDAPASSGELELPMSSKVLRYFASSWAKEQEDLDNADQMGAFEYVAWIFRMGSPLRIAVDYFAMVVRVLRPIALKWLHRWRSHPGPRSGAVRKLDEEQRLANIQRWLARFPGARDEQAHQLQVLASRPAEQSLFAAAQLFYVDRLLLALASAMGAGLALLTSSGVSAFLGCAAALCLFGLGNQLLAHSRRCDAHLLLRAAAAGVAAIFSVRTVVMGHSHRQVDEPVADGTRYLNLGSWSPAVPGLPNGVLAGGRAELRLFAFDSARPNVSSEAEALVSARSAANPSYPLVT